MSESPKIPSAKDSYSLSYKNFHDSRKETPEYKHVYQTVCNEIQKAVKQSRFSIDINLQQYKLSLDDNIKLRDKICDELRSKEYDVQDVHGFIVRICWDFND